MRRRKLVFIAGLSRIGSTLLDMVLGNNDRYIGLGEIYSAILPHSDFFNERVGYTCSCGKVVDQCPFWGGIRKRKHEISGNASLKERYSLIIDHFYKSYGDEMVLVDSSKDIDALKTVLQLEDIEVRVIYLIRDVRSWTMARLDIREKYKDYYLQGGYLKKLSSRFNNRLLLKIGGILIPAVTRWPVYYFFLWYLQNKKYLDYIYENNISSILISYEELCLQTENTLQKLYDYLEIKTNNYSSSTEHSKSHVIFGNVKKYDPALRKDIDYDDHWTKRAEWKKPYAFLPMIARFNRKYVCKNPGEAGPDDIF